MMGSWFWAVRLGSDGVHTVSYGLKIHTLCCLAQAAFGPFYRIEQLIISTQPGDGGNASDAILTDANIKLLFDIQAEVDSLRASDSVRLQYSCSQLLAR